MAYQNQESAYFIMSALADTQSDCCIKKKHCERSVCDVDTTVYFTASRNCTMAAVHN